MKAILQNVDYAIVSLSTLLVASLLLINSCKKEETVLLPLITSFSPSSGPEGTIDTVFGANFSSSLASNLVSFNGLAATVALATPQSLVVIVPVGATSGKITVSVNGNAVTSLTDFIVTPPPTITSFSPSSGLAGATVSIVGTNFSTIPTDNSVKFNTTPAVVTAATATLLTVTVPAEATQGKIIVIVSGQTAISPDDFTPLPAITDFTPALGAVGSSVSITGTGFSTLASNNLVQINGIAATVISASATLLTIHVPPGATDGLITVMVGSNLATSLINYQIVLEVAGAGGTDFDEGHSVAVDASGNVYTTGSFRGTANFGTHFLNSSGSDDIFISKYNPSHELMWVRQAGGTDSDIGFSITVDLAGDIYVTGTFSGTADFGGTPLISTGSFDMFVAKYNSSGDVVWAKSAGSGSTDMGRDVNAGSSGNVYVTGEFFDTATFGTTPLTSSGGSDIFIANYNSSNGDVTWAIHLGGLSDEDGLGITSDSDGNIYVTGSFFGTATFGATTLTSAGIIDAFIARIDANHELVWVKQVAGSSYDNAFSIAVDNSGDCYVAGYFTGSAMFGSTALAGVANEDIFVAKYGHSTGELLWVKGAGGSNYDNAHSVGVDGAGNCYVTGYFQSIANFDSKSLTSTNNSRDAFVAMYDTNGDIQWVKQAGGTDDDNGQGITLDAAGIIYVTGSFRNEVTFGTTPLTSAGNDDIFLWKIRP